MKSPKAVVNVKAKMARLVRLSLLTGMVMNLSMGTALYAADFKLWKLDAEGKAGAPVELVSGDRKLEGAKLIDEGKYSDFVTKFQGEPTQAFEVLSKKLSDLEGREEEAPAFKKALLEGLAKVDFKEFGSATKKVEFMKLAKKLTELDVTDFAKLDSKELLEMLFSNDEAAMKALALTDKKDAAKPEVAAQPLPPTAVAAADEGNVNEVSDEAIQALAQPICDKHNALVEKANSGLKSMQDLVNKVMNQIGALSQVSTPVAKREQAEDVISPLLKQLLGDNKQATAAQAAPAAPQVAPSSTNNDEEQPNPNSVLNQTPPAPTQSAFNPTPFFASPQSNSARPEITLDLPANRGARDLRVAQQAIAASEDVLSQGMPQTVNPWTGMSNSPLQVASQLGASQGQVQSALASVNSAIKTTKSRMAEMDAQIEQLKEGARAALPEWVGTEQNRLQTVYDQAKRNFEQQRQQLTAQAQASGDPNAMAQVSATLGGMSQEMNTAETKLNEFKAQVESKLVAGNKAIAAMKSQRQSLEDVATDLSVQKGKLDAQNKQIADMLMSNAQQFASMQQGQNGAQGPNVNRIQGANPGNTSRGRGLGGAYTGAGVRGSLGNSTASVVGGTTLR